MICPKCQNEIIDSEKLCPKCGYQFVKETTKQDMKPALQQAVCANCGASLIPGIRYCTKCAALLSQGDMMNPVKADADMDSAVETKKMAKKKPKTGIIIVAALVLILLASAAAVGFWIHSNKTEPPALEAVGILNEEESENDSVPQETGDADSSPKASSVQEEVDADALFAEADALLEEGKEKTEVDAEIINGMDVIEDAIHQFVEKAEEAGDIDIAQERIADAYASYVSAVIRYKEMLNGQTLSGNIYSQILSEMEKAEVLADELTDKGFPIDDSYLETEKEEFISQYNDRMITTFNEFTQREMWSRTEAWNLMADADKMFEASDVDNPLRLRYAYALAWWIQKQIETELNNGTITQKDAAIKIANSIKDMDYNPMMLYYYIYYMKEAGEDCAEVEMAYNKIVDHIYDTQGIRIGEDFDLQHFWYFNDFGEYSVDDTNGVTPENRQWIRDYMETVAFVKN